MARRAGACANPIAPEKRAHDELTNSAQLALRPDLEFSMQFNLELSLEASICPSVEIGRTYHRYVRWIDPQRVGCSPLAATCGRNRALTLPHPHVAGRHRTLPTEPPHRYAARIHVSRRCRCREGV